MMCAVGSVVLFLCHSTFFNNMSPGGVFGAGFIHQDLYGHNQFINNTGPGLRVGKEIGRAQL